MERIPEFVSNHLFLVSLFVSILVLLLWNVFGSTLSGIKQIIPAELTRLMNREKGVLVDLRPESEFNDRHILNSINMPEKDVSGRMRELDKNKQQPIIFCCANGTVSTRIARTFLNQGFEKVYCLKGGLPAWTTANLPLNKNT